MLGNINSYVPLKHSKCPLVRKSSSFSCSQEEYINTHCSVCVADADLVMWSIPQFLMTPSLIWSSCDWECHQKERAAQICRCSETPTFPHSSWYVGTEFLLKNLPLSTQIITILHQFQAASTAHGYGSFFTYCHWQDVGLFRLLGVW